MQIELTSDLIQQILESDKIALSVLFWTPIILLVISIIVRVVIHFVCRHSYSYLLEAASDILIGISAATIFIFSFISGFELYRLNNYPEVYIMEHYVTNNNVHIVEK